MINKIERMILANLYRANRFVSVAQLALRMGYSWITINKYIENLEKRGVVIVKRSIRRTYVRIDFKYKARLDKKRRDYN